MTELCHQRLSLRSLLVPSRPSAEAGGRKEDGESELREADGQQKVVDGEMDLAEGLTSTQLDFPLTRDIFARRLHPLVSQ